MESPTLGVKHKDESILSDEIRQSMKTIRELRDRKKNLNAELKDLENQLGNLNSVVVDYFESNKIQSMKLSGIGHFFLNRELYPQVEDKEAVKDWLKSVGDLDLIMTFNTNKFKAYYKERLENKESLPEQVTQYMKVDIRVRKA